MPPDLILVACAGKKAPGARPAKELYTSPWFRFARAVAEREGAPWRILSAKHGVVDPAAVIAPYDLSLQRLPAAARQAWHRLALRSVMEILDPPRGLNAYGRRVLFLAGSAYIWFLAHRLEGQGVEVELPLAGLGIGRQLHYLKARLAGEVQHG